MNDNEKFEVESVSKKANKKTPYHQPGLVDIINVVADRVEPLILLFTTWLEHSIKQNKSVTGHQKTMAILAILVVGFIVITAGILTYLDKVDGSTFTFLLGLVVGYVLTFIREAVYPRKED